MEIGTRRRSSLASCKHVVKNGEKYLKVFYKTGEWVSCQTFCINCAIGYVIKMSVELKKVADS